MIRTALLASVLLASSAFATGERIQVNGAAAALKETLCISMSCVSGTGRDFIIDGKAERNGVRVTVTTSTGQARLSHFAPLNGNGQISSTDLVHATALVVQAIEKGPIASATPPAAKPSKAVAARKVLKGAVAKR